MVMDRELYTPQTYLKSAIGGKYKNKTPMSDAEYIHSILKEEGVETDDSPVWDYPLDKIDHIVENDLYVVLVECKYKEGRKIKKELRWFEVPEGFFFY